ncbi:hypothetical protein HYDPIDRAFT_43722 [Hydnomerulius pinastri MD-312]|uniref:3'-5' exonuclease n=1 Tax=Hydnomerulius pinastri MD-312 TaxID=994086 RepID=A0A0C9V3H3_9AGAM|nr:hypothetical protein HYDPIDRAFT_43722 [Hydnomerulius pinastri MD-312]
MKAAQTNDEDSDWSIEIFDGNVCAPVKVTNSVKQRQVSMSKAGSKDSNSIHPFFLKDFSTKTIISEPRPKISKKAQGVAEKPAQRKAGLKRSEFPCPPPLEPFETNGHDVETPTSEVARSTSNAAGLEPKARARRARASRDKQHSQPDAEVSQKSTALQNAIFECDEAPQPPDALRKKQSNSTKSREGPIPIEKEASSSSTAKTTASSKEGDPPPPAYSFKDYRDPAAAVVYTKCENEANTLVQSLEGPLGFDLEWRVMWKAGAQERRTALVQLCDRRTILLMQVSSMKRAWFPQKVLEVIESASIVKTGANILNDGEKLYRDFGIRARGLVELGALAGKADENFRSVYNREIVSLAKMVAMYLGKTLLKGSVRTANWEAELNTKMVEYAANDCHCALMVYHTLLGIAAKANKKLDIASYSCEVNPRSTNLKDKGTSLLSAVSGSSRSSQTSQALPDYCIPEPPRPQYLRAYKMWHHDKMALDKMCMALRTGGRVEPLKESTVISYVIGALQADARLPFDMGKLKEFVRMEASSWQRHRQWISSRE